MKYIFNINRFLIEVLRTLGKEWALLEAKNLTWARFYHGKEINFNGNSYLGTRDGFEFKKEWCEVREG